MSSNPSSQKLWGIITRRERWALSWRGWLVILAFILLACFLFLKESYPFLAVTHPINADRLVVEGWVHEYAIKVAIGEFQSGKYESIYTTGGPVAGIGHYISDPFTNASVAAGRLRADGVSAEKVKMVPARVIDRDRTYGAALALKTWFLEHGIVAPRMNIVTEDLHARRTRLLFEKAFGNNISIGIIAVSNPDYDARHWWRYSAGVRDLLAETIAYVYARFFFHPV